MKILNPAKTAAALPWDRLVPAIATAAAELAAGKIRAPERQVVPIDRSSVLLCMPAIGPDISVTKLITVHGDNRLYQLPAIQGDVIVFDTNNGRRLALLDGPTVTARRTAAVSLLGIDRLAPKKPESALVIGTGVQAAAHVEALVEYFGITEFHIAARDMGNAERFCERLMKRWPQAPHGLQLRATPHITAATGSLAAEVDLVIALTNSTTPVIPAGIGEHTMAIGVGAFKPEMAEFPPQLLHARQIVVDHRDGARHEAGDLLQAKVDWGGVKELAEVLDGSCKGRPTPVLKTVGQAAWDLAAARVALQ